MIENKNNNHLGDEGLDLELLNEAEKDTSKDLPVEENKSEENSTPIDPKKVRRNKIIFFSCLAGTLVLIAGVAIPVSISIINKNAKPAESSIRIYVTSQREEQPANPVKSLLKGTIIDANLGFVYRVDANGVTKPETYSGYTDNSRMVLSAMKHYEDNKVTSPITFANNLFNYSKGCFLLENTQYDLFIDVNSKSMSYADSLANNLKGAASAYAKKNNVSFNVNIKKGKLDEKYDLTNSILDNVRVLFYEPKGGMNDYVPNKIEGKRFREESWMEYLPREVEELTAISNKLNVVPKFESEDGYMKLHQSLKGIRGLYNNRKKTLESKIKDVDNAVTTNYQNKIDEGDYTIGYEKLPSNKWWKNDYANITYDNAWAVNFFNGVNLNLDTSDTYENLKQYKANIVSYLNDNQKWFSFALEIATQNQRPYDGDQAESPIKPSDSWYGDDNFKNTPPSGENWDDYWYSQFESKGGKQPGK